MKISASNFGPIKNVELDLGDLTILIGPQASGKSLLLELFKLHIDKQHIISTLRNYNFIFDKDRTTSDRVLDWYFGEGLSSLFKRDTQVAFDGERFTPANLLNVTSTLTPSGMQAEKVFYVPAQRIMGIADGRPKNFVEFDNDTPYVLRRFSEILRVFLLGGLGNPDVIFPMKNRLKSGVRESLNQTIFHNAKVFIDKEGSQRKMKLNVDGVKLPFMTWSAGQKEFLPLLLAVYCLSGPPSAVVNKENYQWVVIEEPEMGLHPRAIISVLLEIIELLHAGYKVILSTHSTVFPEFVWAFNFLSHLSDKEFQSAMCELFDLKQGTATAQIFDGLKGKTIRTYFSGSKDEEGNLLYRDISSLDAFDENNEISEWGGLTSFSSETANIVSRYVHE